MPTSPDTSSSLNRRQARAVLALAAGHSVSATAKLAGVTRQTVSEWQAVPKFRAALDALTQDAADQTREELRRLTLEATETLRTLLRNGASESVRLRAALAVLDLTGVARTSGPAEPIFDPSRRDLGTVLDEIEREGRGADQDPEGRTHRSH